MHIDTDYASAGTSGNEIRAFLRMKYLLSADSTEEEKEQFLRETADKMPGSEDISGYSTAIRSCSGVERISGLTDIVGTGGDGMNTINVSTASAIAASALGVKVAKHGNRAISGTHGSADFMRKIGYNLSITSHDLGSLLSDVNFVYLLAPQFNRAFALFADARKRIGRRTVFNMMGPITNPLDPDYLVLGSYSKENAELYAGIMAVRSKTGFSFSAENGMDEISPVGSTHAFYVRDGSIAKLVFNGSDLIGTDISLNEVIEKDPDKCFQKTVDGLCGRNGKISAFIALNTAPALVANGLCTKMEDAYDTAMNAIESGMVSSHLKRIVS